MEYDTVYNMKYGIIKAMILMFARFNQFLKFIRLKHSDASVDAAITINARCPEALSARGYAVCSKRFLVFISRKMK